MSLLCTLYLDRHNIISTWTFLTLANFIFNCLAVIKRIATFNFRMMNKKIFSSILRCDEAKTFTSTEPLNCTFTHIIFSRLMVNHHDISTFEFTVSK